MAPFAGVRAKSAAASMTVYRGFNVLSLRATPRTRGTLSYSF